MIDENKIVRAVSFWLTITAVTALNIYFIIIYYPALIYELRARDISKVYIFSLIFIWMVGFFTILVDFIVSVIFLIMKKNAGIYTTFLLFVVILLFLLPGIVPEKSSKYVTDEDFCLNEEIYSPDFSHVILDYCFSTSPLSWTRSWDAIVPAEYEKLDLSGYEVPEGYNTEGWSENNELILQEGEFFQ